MQDVATRGVRVFALVLFGVQVKRTAWQESSNHPMVMPD